MQDNSSEAAPLDDDAGFDLLADHLIPSSPIEVQFPESWDVTPPREVSPEVISLLFIEISC